MTRRKGSTSTLSLIFFLSKRLNQEAPPILQKPANHSAGWYLMSFIISVYCYLLTQCWWDCCDITSCPEGGGNGEGWGTMWAHFLFKCTSGMGSGNWRRESDTLSSLFLLCYSTQRTEEDDLTVNYITQLKGADERKGGMGKKTISSVFLLSITSISCSSSDIGAWFFCCIRLASFDLFRNPKFDGNLHDW